MVSLQIVIASPNASYLTQYPTPKDKLVRFQLFEENLKEVDKLNAAEKADHDKAVYGISETSDLSHHEFKSRFLGTTMPTESDRLLADVVEVEEFKGESTSVDWRGILTTPIKYQGSCGSCW